MRTVLTAVGSGREVTTVGVGTQRLARPWKNCNQLERSPFAPGAAAPVRAGLDSTSDARTANRWARRCGVDRGGDAAAPRLRRRARRQVLAEGQLRSDGGGRRCRLCAADLRP